MLDKKLYQYLNLSNSQRHDLKIYFDHEKEHHYLPISIINGKEKGKVFTIVAGIHGYEYPPILAVQEVLKEINPNELKGTLIILPIANIGAFYQRSIRVNRDDNKNLNYIFPGNENGTISDRLADYITREIIPNSDIFLDIHGGDANEDLFPFSLYYDNEKYPENTLRAKQLCEVSGFPYLVSYPFNLSDDEPALYAYKQAVQMGKIGVSLEAGKLGGTQEDCTQMIKTAIYNMLDLENILPKKEKIESKDYIFLTQQTYIRVPIKGLFYSPIISGDQIQEGQNLGYITDEFGNVLEEIFAPCDGIVLYKIGTPPVNVGETMFCIAK